MEVKSGYKQTDVGVIPEDWDVVEASKLDPFITSGSRGWAKYYSDRGALFMRMTNLSRDSIYPDLSDQKFVELPKTETEGLRTALQDGDILISITADIGIIGYVNPSIPKPAYINQHIACLRLPHKEADSLFQSYYLASHQPQRRFAAITDVGAKTGINLTTVGKLKLLRPPLPEQHAIAEALRDADGLLEGLDRLIAKKRDLKQAAMQQLLTGRTRLPGFKGEWAAKTLGELFNFSGGYSASRDQLSDKGHCYLHYGDIHGSSKSFVDTRADYQDIPKLDIPLKQVSFNSLLKDGDVVFVDASEDDEGASKHVVVMNKDNVPFISGLHTIVAKSKTDELAHEYRRYCFQTLAIRQQFLFYAVGTKVTGISKTNIAKLTLPVPTVPEQTAIAAVLTDMDAELATLEQRRKKTRALKQAMMQELLTGKTRLVSEVGCHG
jgi:type I restriction enzyme, S subunit